MKNSIKDALQITAALLITGSTALAMQPPKIQPVHHTAVVVAKKTTAAVNPPVQQAPAPVQTPETPAPVETPVTEPVQPPQPTYGGSHEDWMAAAGIAPSDYAAVDYIVSRESGWDPNATEPNSGAHGLPQALPYSKTGCGWVDPICQLQWANGYAISRYGGWWPAQAYWQAHRNW